MGVGDRRQGVLSTIRRTPLYGWHVDQGAHMGEFSGYLMPLWYSTGIRGEHRAVLTTAGLFDTSHMGVLAVEGTDAFKLLQRCFSRDLMSCGRKSRERLSPGKCVYGVFLNSTGSLVDDAIVYCLTRDRYLIVVNAGMGSVVVHHLAGHDKGSGVKLRDLSGTIGKIDLQGPQAARILQVILEDSEAVFRHMTYFAFRGEIGQLSGTGSVQLKGGHPVIVSRTGYTGEFGFELFVESDQLATVWELIVSSGGNRGGIPCGLAARDSLRVGAGLPLAGRDIGPWLFVNNPWTFVLPHDRKTGGFSKRFVGDTALLQARKADYTHAYVGYDARKVSLNNHPVVLDGHGNEIGSVLTCVTDTAIGYVEDRLLSIASKDRPPGFDPQGLCCGFLKTYRRLNVNEEVTLKDRIRNIRVRIVDEIRPDRSARRNIKEML